MRILALDLSTSTGYAVLESGGDKPVLVRYGVIQLEKAIYEYSSYPWSYVLAAQDMADRIKRLIEEEKPDQIVIEEINLGKNRYSQKGLDSIHFAVLVMLMGLGSPRTIYISSSEWRSNLALTMSASDKTGNRKLSEAKSVIRARYGGLDSREARAALADAKRRLGIRGKISKKHVAIRYVNERFGLTLKAKDDDVADAICLCLAALNGATPCDGAGK